MSTDIIDFTKNNVFVQLTDELRQTMFNQELFRRGHIQCHDCGEIKKFKEFDCLQYGGIGQYPVYRANCKQCYTPAQPEVQIREMSDDELYEMFELHRKDHKPKD